MFPSHVMGALGTNRIYSVGRVVKVKDRMRWGFTPAWVRHVMGTFGTNRIYSVGRVVKVKDRMRWGFALAWVRFPPNLKCKNHHKFSPLGDVSTCEIQRESNPRGSKPPSHTVLDLNHATNRVYTIGTERSHRMRKSSLSCLSLTI